MFRPHLSRSQLFIRFSLAAIGPTITCVGAFSQSTSVHQPSAAEIAATPTDHSIVAQHEGYHRVLDDVCSEDSRIRRYSPGDPATLEHRRQTYADLIGIDPASADTLISILLSSCGALRTNEGAILRAKKSQISSTDDYATPGSTVAQTLATLHEQLADLLDQTRTELQESLTSGSFEKTDTWILRYGMFGPPKQPGSQHNDAGPVVVNQPLSPLRVRYMLFFGRLDHEARLLRHYATEEGQLEAERLAEQGQMVQTTRLPYDSMIGLTSDEADSMISISLAGYDSIRKIEKQARSISDQFRAQYTARERAQMPHPAQLTQLNDQRWETVEKTVQELHKTLGESAFQKLDVWVIKHFGYPDSPSSAALSVSRTAHD